MQGGSYTLLEYLIESFLYNKDVALIHVNSINSHLWLNYSLTENDKPEVNYCFL